MTGTDQSARGRYRYEATIYVTFEADGLHADGNGATAMVNRICQKIAVDHPRVDGAVPSPPRYIGANRAALDEDRP